MSHLAGTGLLAFGAFTFMMGANSGRLPWIIAGGMVIAAAALMITSTVRSRPVILAALGLASVIGYFAQVDAAEAVNLSPALVAWAAWVLGWFALGAAGTKSPSQRSGDQRKPA
jgi:hypothetical protein